MRKKDIISFFLLIFKRMNKEALYLFLGVMPAICSWIISTQKYPMKFWSIANDSAIMALSHAMNLDDWLEGKHARKIETPQIYHPGVYYQFFSWMTYRLSSMQKNADPSRLAEDTMRDPEPFWNLLQLVPLALTLITALFLWGLLQKNEKIYFPPIFLSFFVVSIAYRHGTWDLFNESFAFPLAAAFFSINIYFFRFWRVPGPARYWACAVAGIATGLIYLNKANLVLWGVALVPIMVLQDRYYKFAINQTLGWLSLYVTAAGITIVGVACLFFGIKGLEKMAIANWELVQSSGTYGSGPKTFINLPTFLKAATTLLCSEKYLWLIYVLICGFLIVEYLIKRIKTGQLSEDVFAAMFAMVAPALMFIGICKHYISYYIVAIVAVYPILLYLLAKNGKKWQIWIISFCVAFGTWDAFKINLDARKKDFYNQHNIEKDWASIMGKYPLKAGEVRLWMYRTTVPEFQRSFLAEFSGMPELQRIIQKIQPGEFHFSPWHDMVLIDGKWEHMSNVKWNYLVYDLDGESYITNKYHPWHIDNMTLKANKNKLVLIQRSSSKVIR